MRNKLKVFKKAQQIPLEKVSLKTKIGGGDQNNLKHTNSRFKL